MLKLKKLQILGFKSFCDRTELKFHGDGVAAIVGPNGCGKSNIADAISWVLGEQSAKTLRGSRMEDVIFAGTRDRKPTGMAEVCLTLIDPEEYDGPDANRATEIEIRDEMAADDWDEAEVRARAAEEVERLTEEAQPGQTEEVEATLARGQALWHLYPEDEPRFAGFTNPNPPLKRTDPESQVVLKIRRRKFHQQFRAGEIIVTRRLFRSGDSEYLLNGKLCRLRDIQELFMGTGLGPESYALIEQGRIGQILSSRPTDRRAIIEEAAGITKFKTRKRLAEARLEDAKQNLARVNDIFDEVTRQMNSLKRQASKAERYAKLRDEMRVKLRLVLASKFGQLERERTEVETQIQSLSGQLREQTDAVQQLETEHAERTQRGYDIEAEVRENRERLSQIRLESDRAQAKRLNNGERCTELVARMAACEAESAQAASRIAALETERDANREAFEFAADHLAAAKRQLIACQDEATAATTALTDLESRQEASRAAILEVIASLSDRRNQLTQAEERMAAIDRDSQRLQAEMASASSQVETFGGQRKQTELEFETISQRLTGVSDEIVRVRGLLDGKREDETRTKNHLDTLRAEYATAMGRRASLEAVTAEHGYSTESVRRLFQSGSLNGGLAPVGVLADFLEVEPRYESVVEDFLRDELNYIVVKSWDAADEGLRLLRSDVEGRATFLVHPEDSQAKFSFAVNEADRAVTPGPLVALKDAIRVLNGFGRSLEVIFPKLRDGYIVPEAGFARELALENPQAFFLAQSGECFHNVTVTGGKQRAEGPLSLKRELREVTRQQSEIEAALRAEELRALTLSREIKELAGLLERLEGDKREAEKQAMTSGNVLQRIDAEMVRIAERLETSRREFQRLNADREEQQSLAASHHAELATLQQKREELERLSTSANEQLATLRDRRDPRGPGRHAAVSARGHTRGAPSDGGCRPAAN